jgi:uncharacterized lipoprotein YajG
MFSLKKILTVPACALVGLVLLAACSSTPATPTVVPPTATSVPTAQPTIVLPTVAPTNPPAPTPVRQVTRLSEGMRITPVSRCYSPRFFG